jgi:hypothetical protein
MFSAFDCRANVVSGKRTFSSAVIESKRAPP